MRYRCYGSVGVCSEASNHSFARFKYKRSRLLAACQGTACPLVGGIAVSMRKSSRSELRMLRTMMTHFGVNTKCYFCKQPLLTMEEIVSEDGSWHLASKTAPLPIKTKMTIHHRNGDHNDQSVRNRKPCHQKCHKRFHMKERHAKSK